MNPNRESPAQGLFFCLPEAAAAPGAAGKPRKKRAIRANFARSDVLFAPLRGMRCFFVEKCERIIRKKLTAAILLRYNEIRGSEVLHISGGEAVCRRLSPSAAGTKIRRGDGLRNHGVKRKCPERGSPICLSCEYEVEGE